MSPSSSVHVIKSSLMMQLVPQYAPMENSNNIADAVVNNARFAYFAYWFIVNPF